MPTSRAWRRWAGTDHRAQPVRFPLLSRVPCASQNLLISLRRWQLARAGPEAAGAEGRGAGLRGRIAPISSEEARLGLIAVRDAGCIHSVLLSWKAV